MARYKTLFLLIPFFVISAAAQAEIIYTPKQAPLIFDKQNAPFSFSQEKWNEMRRAIEEGRKPGEKVVVSTVQVVLPELPPPPSGAVVELPYETRLSITGRKLIGVEFKAIQYDIKKDNRDNRIDFNMTQELQVRIKGQVGRKILVNVDFDDTVPDKRDISVVYRGDPDEVVQEAAFGDITLSLPNTEFVGYSKPAFGIKLNTKYKRWRGYFIASQAKGTPETKRFTGGNTQLKRPEILDINYIPKKYYKLAFGTDTIKPGTEEIRIDRRDPAKIQNSLFIFYSSGAALTPAASGYFDLMLAGNDYTVDYTRGIIIFRNNVQPANAIIAVNYQRADGTWLNTGLTDKSTFYNYKIIKDETDTIGITTELKNYYNLGQTQIIRDNGRGNFVLKIVKNSASLDEPSEIDGKTVPKYPATIVMNFEAGLFWLTDANGNPYHPFPGQVYARSPITSGHKFFIEYRYTTKTFSLRPGIIPQSEQVVLDSLLLKRDIDYFIDYDAGILTFMKEEKFTELSVLDVTYEYAPLGGLGGQVGDSFIGMRHELSLTDNVFIGGSYMQNFPPRPQNIPDIRSVPQDLQVTEFDSRVSGIPFRVPLLGTLSFGFGGELAQSNRNMNTWGRATIENMENIRQEDGASLFKDSWKYGWTQTQYYAFGNDKDKNPNRTNSSIYWDNIDVLENLIYGKTTSKNEKFSVMNLNYNFVNTTEAAVMQNLSSTGLDFSKKLYLELRVKLNTTGTPAGQLKIELGKFNEDTDHSGTFKREDKKISGILSAGEDIGWAFVNPDGAPAQIGANNGQIDSMDIDGNGMLDTFDSVTDGANGTFVLDLNSDILSKATADNNGWIYITRPITMTNRSAWEYVKQMRITVKAPGQSGTLQIAGLSIVGNKWENITPGPVEVSAVNNYDDTDYKLNSFYDKERTTYESIYGQTILEEGTTKKEQALQLKFTNTVSSSALVGTKVTYTRAIDLTTHKKIRLFVFPQAINGNQFVFRAGHDDNNYYEYSTSLTVNNTWKMIEIEQPENPATGLPDSWINTNPNDTYAKYGSTTAKVGNPSLTNITTFKILLSTSPSQTGKIWVDEIYASESGNRKGYAYKGYGDLSLPGWFSAGGGGKRIDGKFETFIQPIKNQESLDENAYFNFANLSKIGGPILSGLFTSPQNFSASRSQTETPFLDKTGDLVSYLNADKNIRTNFNYNTSLSFPWGIMPSFGGGYSISVSSISNRPQKIFRTDTSIASNLSFNWNWPRMTGFSYFDSLFPSNISANGSETKTDVNPWDSYRIGNTSATVINVSTGNPITHEVSTNYSVRAPWNIWQRINFNPSYSQSYTKEDKFYSVANYNTSVFDLSYDKSRAQTAGASASLRITPWFSPSANYNIQTSETYNFGVQDKEKVSKLKAVNRHSAGDVSTSFGMSDILPSLQPTRSLSLSGNYQIDDGDTYENLYSSYSTFDKLWIRDNLLDEKTMTRYNSNNTIRTSGRWNVLEGIPFPSRLEPMKRLSTSANFSESKAFTNATGTKTRSYVLSWPDLLFSLSDIEKMFGGEKYVSDTRINYKRYSKFDLNERYAEPDANNPGKWNPQVESKVFNQNIDSSLNLFRNYSLSLSYGETRNTSYDYTQKKTTSLSKNMNYSAQIGFEFRRVKLTPRYGFSDDKAWAGDPDIDQSIREKPTNDLKTETYGLSVYSDTSFPGGLRIPLIGKKLDMTNRFIFNVNYTFTKKSTEKGDVSKNNTDQHSASLNADYEISGNLRMRVGAGYDRFINRGNASGDDNYSSYNASGQLTIIF